MWIVKLMVLFRSLTFKWNINLLSKEKEKKEETSNLWRLNAKYLKMLIIVSAEFHVHMCATITTFYKDMLSRRALIFVGV